MAVLDELSSSKKDAKRCLIIVNLKKKRISKEIELTNVTTNEPEDIDFWDRKIVMYCGQTGGLYKISPN